MSRRAWRALAVAWSMVVLAIVNVRQRWRETRPSDLDIQSRLADLAGPCQRVRAHWAVDRRLVIRLTARGHGHNVNATFQE
jgi:hypothetical protein